MKRLILRALSSGTVASLATTAALAMLARAEGRRALQPTNATSHMLHGDSAGHVRHADVPHTMLGYVVHHASAVFWAAIYQAWRARRGAASKSPLGDAMLLSAVAAFVDYVVVPRRLSPGWEIVLPKSAIALTYVAMAFALAATERGANRRD